MRAELIYSTPNYHKLVETIARVCYQSYDKETPVSHKSIRAIMAKGHLSIASVGNIVFKITDANESFKDALLEFHQSNMFIKWTKTDNDYLVSMNMLTLLDLWKSLNNLEFSISGAYHLDVLMQLTDQVPCLKWFYDKTVELPESVNEYSFKGCPKLYEPIVLDEDYTKLRALGLNNYELGIHATITMNFITDRSASLQFWRHWSGGCELSQRYVKRDDSRYRPMIDIEEEIQHLLDIINERNLEDYIEIYELCKAKGMRDGRAKEVARSILANGIFTQLIQCRPYRNWIHLFKLRDDKHAQSEIQEDVIHIKRVLNQIGVLTG